MTSRDPYNIPNKHKRELYDRLVPKQKLHGHPVTFASTLSKNHPNAKTSFSSRPKKLPPLQVMPEKKKEVVKNEPEIVKLPSTKDPMEYIKRAKAGLDSREYVYLEPTDNIENTDNPTNLQIIPPQKINESNFWTLSLKGLTHFNRPIVDFIPLDQWIRENNLFISVMQIPFFKYQRQWRHFKTWRHNIQNQKLTKAKQSLKTNLFFANPIFRPAFIKIQNELNKLENMKLYVLNPQKMYTLEHFLEENEKYRVSVRQKLEEFYNTLITLVAGACEKLMDTQRGHEVETYNGKSPLDQLIDQYEKSSKTPEAKLAYETPGILKYTNKATHNALCQQAVRFVRMVDSVVINGIKTLHDLSLLEMYSTFVNLQKKGKLEHGYENDSYKNIEIKEQWEGIYQKLLDVTAQTFSKPIFSINVSYDNGLHYEPNLDNVIDKVEIVRVEIIKMLTAIPRLLTHPVFRPYITRVLESGPTGVKKLSTPDISHILHHDPIYKTSQVNQKHLLDESFKLLEHYSNTFKQSLKIYEKNLAFNVEFLESEKITAKEIRAVIKELKDQEVNLEQIEDVAEVGIYEVCAEQLKKLFIKSPSQCLNKVEETISKIASKFLVKFSERVRDAYNDLSVNIESVQQLVDYINAVKSQEETIKELYHFSELIRDLHNLSKEIGIEIPKEELMEFSEVVPVFEAVKRFLSYSDDNTQKLLPKFQSQLEKSVSALHSSVIEVVLLANNVKLSSLKTSPEEAQQILDEVVKRTNEMNENAKKYNNYQKVMSIPVTDFDDVEQLVKNVELKKLLWDTKMNWVKMTKEWCETPFVQIDPEPMVGEIHNFVTQANLVAEGLPDNEVALDLKEKVDHFSTMVPIISDLKNPSLKQTHMEQIENLLGEAFFANPQFNFGTLVKHDAYLYVDRISQISIQATNEQALLDQLVQVQYNINQLQFNPVPFKNYKNIYYLEGIDDINSAIDDARATLSSIRASYYVAQHRSRAEEWIKLITVFRLSIETISKCQNQFSFLSDVFLNVDIARQLPSSQKDLSQVEKSWKAFSQRAFDDPSAFKLCSTGNIINDLNNCNQLMYSIRKDIDNYLDMKRSVFPRLYLLSNNEFISLLSKPKEIHAIIPFMPKIFAGIHSVEFSMNSNVPSITSVVSELGERLQIKPVKYNNNVESWLLGLYESMQKTVKNDIKSAQSKFREMVREDWIQITNIQCILVSVWLERSFQLEYAIQHSGVEHEVNEIINDITSGMQSCIRSTHLDLHPVERNKIESLLVTDMYWRDIAEGVIDNQITSIQDPHWTEVITYKWDKNTKELVVVQNLESFDYGYEYFGHSIRIVHSPNIFTSHMSFASAFKTHFSTAVIGKPDTGKTETILSFAEIFGQFVGIRTCISTMKSSQITAWMKGAAQGGFWLVLENFSSLNSSVVSAVSEQFQSILYAKNIHAKKFELDGLEIPLNNSVNIFITLSDSNYFNTKLPQNLKEVLRPVNMPPLEFREIASQLLIAFGFVESPDAAISFEVLFNIGKSISDVKSRPFFSMRSFIKVLEEGKRIRIRSEYTENEVLARAFTNIVITQLSDKDRNILSKLVAVEFGYDIPIEEPSDNLITALTEASNKLSLTINKYLFTKCIELHTTSSTGRVVVIAGDPCSGKTSVMRLLEEARILMHEYSDVYSKINRIQINPSVNTVAELYGFVDRSGIWNEGVLGCILKDIKEKTEFEQWIIFDSPLDSQWSDVLIPAFDAHHTVTLSSGSSVMIPKHTRFIFETNSIATASPAILSRAALIVMSSKELGTDVFVDKAMKLRVIPLFEGKTRLIERVNDMIKVSINPGIDYIKEQCSFYMPYTMIETFFAFFTTLLRDQSFEDNNEGVTSISSIFSYSYIWAFAGFMNNSQRIWFESFVRDILTEFTPFPPRGILFDYFLEPSNCKWFNWSEKVKKYGVNENGEFTKTAIDLKNRVIFIPTIETVRLNEIMNLALYAHRHIIFMGADNSGKTTIVKNIVNEIAEKEGFTTASIPFPRRTTGVVAQSRILSYLERINGKYLQPLGKTEGIFILDRVNEIRELQPFEIIRSILNGDGLRVAPSYKSLPTKNLSIIAISNLKMLSERITSHAYSLQYTPPDTTVLTSIITSYFSVYVNIFPEKIRQEAVKCAMACSAFFEKLQSTLSVPDNMPQLRFNLHDLFLAVRNIFYVSPKYISQDFEIDKLIFAEIYRVFADRISQPLSLKVLDEAICSAVRAKCGIETVSVDRYNKIIFADLDMIFSEFNYQTCKLLTEEEVQNSAKDIIKDYINAKRIKSESIIPLNSMSVHLARLLKILKRPHGHAILFGNVGTGKSTVTKLALFAASSEVIEASSCDDLRMLILKTGLNGKRSTLIVRTSLLSDEQFMEDVSLFISTDNPLIFLTAEDIDRGCNEIVFYAKQIEANESINTLRKLLIERILTYAHIIFLVDEPNLSKFANYEKILCNVDYDYYEALPDEPLSYIGKSLLANIPEKQKFIDSAIFIHHSIIDVVDKYKGKIPYIITPSLFVNFLNAFINIYEKKTEEINKNKALYDEASSKTAFIASFIKSTEVLLNDLQPQFDSKTEEANRLTNYISENEVTFEKVSQRLIYEEKIIKKKEDEITSLSKEVTDELENVMPQLNNAIAQLKGLNRGDIMDLKSFGEPPIVVKTVMEVICILAEVDVKWKSSVQLLSDPTFINRISSKYSESNHIPDEILEKIQPYIESNPNFQESEVGRVSVAAKSLCTWATCLYNYELAFKTNQPKLHNIEKKKKTLSSDMKILEKRRADVQALSSTIAELRARHDGANVEKRRLSEKIEESKVKLQHAKRLLQILQDQERVWKTNRETQDKNSETTLCDSFISAAFLVYFGPLPTAERDNIYNSLHSFLSQKGLKISPTFSFTRFMLKPSTPRKWAQNGLPEDRSCITSACIFMNTEMAPYIMDRTGIAAQFIKNVEAERQLSVIRPTTHNICRAIESAIRLGVPILMEDCGESLDPTLEQLTQRSIFKQDSKTFIKMGDKIAECDEDYKFYITASTVDSPSTQIFTKCSVVSFDVSPEAFAKQQLTNIVAIIDPDLHKRITELNLAVDASEESINATQTKLIDLMRNAKEDTMLNDDILISAVESCRAALSEANKKLVESQTELNTCLVQKNAFLPVANRIALVSDCATRVSHHFSSHFVGHVVNTSLQGKHGGPEKLTKAVTEALFIAMAGAMTRKDQLQFAFAMTTDILIAEQKMTSAELNLIMKRPNRIAVQNPSPLPQISEQIWERINALSVSHTPFANVPKLIAENAVEIDVWFNEKPTDLPQFLSKGLSEAEKLVLYRELLPQRSEFILQRFIASTAGEKFSEPVTFNIESLLKIAGPSSPVLISIRGQIAARSRILSALQDRKLHVRSAGSTNVEKTVSSAMSKGEWVLIENCEAAPKLVAEIDAMIAKGGANSGFLLFMTSTDFSTFPPRLLNISVKYSLESPFTPRLSAQSCVDSLQPDFFQNRYSCHVALQFALLHSEFHSRSLRNGFISHCLFDESDFRFASRIIHPFLSLAQSFPYQTINSELSLCYGGHSESPLDKKIAHSVVDNFFSETSGPSRSPTTRDQVIEYVNHIEDNHVISEEQQQVNLQPLQYSQFIDSAVKRLPELDEMTFDSDGSNPIDTVFERNAELVSAACRLVKSSITSRPAEIATLTVPAEWRRVLPWQGDINSWLDRLYSAVETTNLWWRKSRPSSILISSFADPRSFLSAVLAQNSVSTNSPFRSFLVISTTSNCVVSLSGLRIVSAQYDDTKCLFTESELGNVNDCPSLGISLEQSIPDHHVSCPVFDDNDCHVTTFYVPTDLTDDDFLQRFIHFVIG